MELTEFEKYILKNHPDPDSITMMEQEIREMKFGDKNPELVLKRIGLEWDAVIKLAENYKNECLKELRKAFNVSFDQCEELIGENQRLRYWLNGYKEKYDQKQSNNFCESCGSSNCIC